MPHCEDNGTMKLANRVQFCTTISKCVTIHRKKSKIGKSIIFVNKTCISVNNKKQSLTTIDNFDKNLPKKANKEKRISINELK